MSRQRRAPLVPNPLLAAVVANTVIFGFFSVCVLFGLALQLWAQS